MLRIIGFVLLLIISRISFADTIAATSVTLYSYYTTLNVKTFNGEYSSDLSTACANLASSGIDSYSWVSGDYTYRYTSVTTSYSDYVCTLNLSSTITNKDGTVRSASSKVPVSSRHEKYGYTCPSGYYQSDASGTASSTAAYCTKTVDACAALSGQQYILNVSVTNTPTEVCFDKCIASKQVSASLPDSTDVYTAATYTLTGKSCTGSETGDYVTDAVASAANTAAAETARVAKEEKACGGEGYYTTGTANGSTVVTCVTPVTTTTSSAQSTSTSSNSDGSTTTTTTDTTGSTTTAGSSSGGTGSSVSSTTTTTTATTTNPDGSTLTTSSSSSTASYPGTTTSFNYKDTDRNDWSSKNFQTVIQSNVDKLKSTAIYSSVTGFFVVSFSGTCSPTQFSANYQGATMQSSFDWCTELAPYQVYIRAIVLFICSWVAFRRAIE